MTGETFVGTAAIDEYGNKISGSVGDVTEHMMSKCTSGNPAKMLSMMQAPAVIAEVVAALVASKAFETFRVNGDTNPGPRDAQTLQDALFNTPGHGKILRQLIKAKFLRVEWHGGVKAKNTGSIMVWIWMVNGKEYVEFFVLNQGDSSVEETEEALKEALVYVCPRSKWTMLKLCDQHGVVVFLFERQALAGRIEAAATSSISSSASSNQ